MARICVDLGRVNSKYDCVLGANLNPDFPVDRHVFVKRLRVWVNADGFLSPLDFKNLASFEVGPPAVWNFVASAGDGRTVEIELRAEMVEGKNTTVFHFSRPSAGRATGKQLPADADVRLTVRFDIEDRNFHWETKCNGGADFHFSSNCHPFRSSRGNEALTKKTKANQACHLGCYRNVDWLRVHARARPPTARFCRCRRLSSAAGMVREHSASRRAVARPDRQRRRLQPRLV